MARTHHDNATTVKGKMKDDTVSLIPLLSRSLQCPYCPMKCALKQYLTIHLQAKHGQPKKEAEHNLLKARCEESVAHLLECPSLRELRKKHGLETLRDREAFFSAQLSSFLKELFQLESPLSLPLDSSKLKPAQAVKRHRSPTVWDTVPTLAATKLIKVSNARAIRKCPREADSLSKAFCFKVPLGEARVGLHLSSTIPADFQSHRRSSESSVARAE
ncbi:unnamed protein product [Trypanosoma congolense IL3000]|uniref:WGS project CAEQ00000000 data, annotated contig 1244 n=1 Tax=Trypanosoma congolense (strain IL3000) TaxID=1068625 RepID=F9W4W5_TRYCI|nr:unnamed protein product [Trypanosoma congolense IL3000]